MLPPKESDYQKSYIQLQLSVMKFDRSNIFYFCYYFMLLFV